MLPRTMYFYSISLWRFERHTCTQFTYQRLNGAAVLTSFGASRNQAIAGNGLA